MGASFAKKPKSCERDLIMSVTDWISILSQFAFLSFLAVGGVMSVAPDMHRVVVVELSILSNEQFLAAITLGKLSPGPNALFVAVLGYQIAGIVGAIAMTGAMIIPSAIFAFYVTRWRRENSHRLSVQSFSICAAPVVVGLLLSTGFVLIQSFSDVFTMICVLVVALIVWKSRLHLMSLMAIGALLGAIGVV